MQKIKTFGLAVLLATACGLSVQAQSNNTAGPVQPNLISAPSLMGGIEQIGEAFTSATNWTADASFGRGLSGGDNNIAFVGAAYNFVDNVGIIAGYEIIYGKGKPQVSTVAGGITLNGSIKPLAFFGGTGWTSKLSGRLYVNDLLATPRNGNALGNLIITGISFNIVSFKNFEFVAGASYENRQGQGKYDGGYALINLGITRLF